jgi:hypothetical protein
MKTILNYLKYLTTKPLKILWLVAVNIIVQIIGFFIFSGDLYAENGSLIMWFLGIFVTAIYVVANLQPWIEWRDGLDKSEK